MYVQKRKSFNLFLSLFLVLATQAACAGTMGASVSPWNYVATLSAGPAWQSGGQTQTLDLGFDIIKTYSPNKSTTTLADIELFLGMQHALTAQILGQLGAAVGVTSDARLSGDIWDDADPQYNNFTYQYKVQHTHVALQGKLLADMGYVVTPWVSASVGVGFNRSYSFRDARLLFEGPPTPDFRPQTKTSFTYTVGAGVQKALTNNWQVGVGYEFADWGHSQLSRTPEQTINSAPALNHLYTNGLMFHVTYLA